MPLMMRPAEHGPRSSRSGAAARRARRARGLRRLGIGVATAVAVVAAGLAGSGPGDGEWRPVFFDSFAAGLSPAAWGRYDGQPGGDPGGWWSPSQVVVSHGLLSLVTSRDPARGDRWVSGGVSSAPALRQTYGAYDVRMRLQPGAGVAFVALLWPVGNGWPPEIDFAENGGGSRDYLTATLHYGPHDDQIQHTVRGDFTAWHVLGVRWSPGRLDFVLDGHTWATITGPEVPDQPMELDLQTQTGTCGDVADPCPTSATPARVDAQISWVAAYAWRPAG